MKQLSFQFSRLSGKTFPAGAVGHRVGIGDLEPALLQVVTVVEFRAADKEGALGIDDDIHPLGGDQDIARDGAINEIHLVLEAGAPAADNGDTERPVGTALFGEE